MTQDRNYTFVKTLRGVLVATMMVLASGNAMAEGVVVHGNVYGGGNTAEVGGDASVTLKGNTVVLGNVFGGGNQGIVQGSTTVNIEN